MPFTTTVIAGIFAVPSYSKEAGLKVTSFSVIAIDVCSPIVTLQCADKLLPSRVAAVIIASPLSATAVILPEASTVTISESLLDHVGFTSVAPSESV